MNDHDFQDRDRSDAAESAARPNRRNLLKLLGAAGAATAGAGVGTAAGQSGGGRDAGQSGDGQGGDGQGGGGQDGDDQGGDGQQGDCGGPLQLSVDGARVIAAETTQEVNEGQPVGRLNGTLTLRAVRGAGDGILRADGRIRATLVGEGIPEDRVPISGRFSNAELAAAGARGQPDDQQCPEVLYDLGPLALPNLDVRSSVTGVGLRPAAVTDRDRILGNLFCATASLFE